MIKNNFFYVENLENVVFLGYIDIIEKLYRENKKLKLNSYLISTKDQIKSKKINVKHEISYNFNSKIRSNLKKKFDIKKTLFISFGCRYIFKKETIQNFFSGNLINFHGARLPYDAGAGHWSWKILRGERISNQLVHLIDKSIDKGPIIDYKTTIFPSSCRIPTEFDHYANNNLLVFYKNFISKIISGKKFQLKHQLDYLGTYYPRLNTEINGWIDWNMKSYEIERFINAFDDPYSGSSTTINKQFVKIKRVQLSSGDTINHPFMTGLIIRHHGDWIVVSTRDKNVLLIEKVLNIKNQNIISKLKVGDRFFTSDIQLSKSKKDKVKYSSKGIQIS